MNGRFLLVVGTLLSGGCGMSPLSNRIEIGKNPFVVFVGEGKDRHTDLFAAEPGGGKVYQITFSPVMELQPRITPDGSMLAFLRMKDSLPGTPRELVVMSLVTGSEKAVLLPTDAGIPQTIAWSDDAKWLYVATDQGLWRVASPPASTVESVPEGDRIAAIAALESWAGQPRFARIMRCLSGGVCLLLPAGDTASVTTTGHDGFAWGRDSVAWFEQDELVVRSLGAGTPRRISWKNPPAQIRDGSYAGRVEAAAPRADSLPGR